MKKHWHAMNNNEVLAELNSSESGISKADAKIRLEQIGPNKLPTPKPPTLLKIFFGQFLNPVDLHLIGCGCCIFVDR